MPFAASSLSPVMEQQIITHGPLALDIAGYAVTVGEQDVPLTVTEFMLLKALALQPYRVLDRASLVEAVRAEGYSLATQPMSPRAVDLHISRLRRKLVEAGFDGIKTMRYVGYRLVPGGEG